METKKSVTTNKYGQVILTSDEIFELLLQGKTVNRVVTIDDEDILLYKKYQEGLLEEITVFLEEPVDTTFEEYHNKCANEWLFPEEYKTINVLDWLIKKCKSQEELDRVNLEYTLYEAQDLVMLLRFFIFLVDYMRSNKFVWGVGRGSSVSSYILYLIGIHRVNSILYNLDIRDYLK